MKWRIKRYRTLSGVDPEFMWIAVLRQRGDWALVRLHFRTWQDAIDHATTHLPLS